MSSTLERAARRAWIAWANYARFGRCSTCGKVPEYVRARLPRGPWLCLECFDQSPEAERRNA